MSEIWTVRRVLLWTTEHFEKRDIDSPRLTAEVLLAYLLKVDRVRLYVDLDRPLSKEELALYRKLIERRLTGEPTQYLTGKKDFYNRSFQVDSRVLVPRPETELLVEAVLSRLGPDTEIQLIDLCTGSGCIALTLAAERKKLKAIATDLSSEALEVAKANAASLGLEERVVFFQGNLFEAVPQNLKFDVVVSNPPYIASAEIEGLSKEVRCEPQMALDGGPDGLAIITAIAHQSLRRLNDGGFLALEIGDHQGEAVKKILIEAGYENVRVEKDLSRFDRLAFAQTPAAAAPQ